MVSPQPLVGSSAVSKWFWLLHGKVFELSVAGISAKLQELVEAAESRGLENGTRSA